MRKLALMIYGPPGAGKGTQANLLAWRKNFIHFDTGKYLEQLVHDPNLKNDKVIRRERKLFDSGILMTPSFVLKVTSDKTKEIAKAGFNVVFSGSPRTLFEALGDTSADLRKLNADKRGNKQKGLIDILEELYGKKNIYPVFLKIDPTVSIQRNKNRLVCGVCANAVLYNDASHWHKTCPLCGAELRRRVVDNPKVFKTRIQEYQKRTFPILEGLKKRGYKIINIDGSPLPYKVHQQILKKLPI